MTKQRVHFVINDGGTQMIHGLVRYITNHPLDLGALGLSEDYALNNRWVSLDEQKDRDEVDDIWLDNQEILSLAPFSTRIISALSLIDPDLVIPTSAAADFFSGLILYALGADSTTHDLIDLALYIAMTKTTAGDVMMFRPDLNIVGREQKQVYFLVGLVRYLLSLEFAPLGDYVARELTSKINAIVYNLKYHYARMSFQMEKVIPLIDDARKVFEKRMKTHPVIVGLRSGYKPASDEEWEDYLTRCAQVVGTEWKAPKELITFRLPVTNEIATVRIILAALPA
ncbi:MAG: hypothetical protein M1420_00255 [Actinobacteria bacterium]|nr:hypothetical protein [Actinomycetota bacterium]